MVFGEVKQLITKIKNITNTEAKKRLLSNFFSLSILQVFTYILPLLILPYLVKVLGVEKFGLVMFAQAFIMFFNILVDYGFNLSATREISLNKDNKEKITEIFSSVMIIKSILIIVSFVILNIMIFSFEKFSTEWELYYLTFLWVVGQAMFPIWYFQGMEKMKYITIINIVSKLLFTILIFIVIKEPSDYMFVPLVNGLGFIVGGLLSLWIVYKNFKQSFVSQSCTILKTYFIDSSQFFLSRVSITIYTSANAFVLGLFTSNSMVGYYAIAERLYMALQSLYNPITQVLYPYISKEKNTLLFKKIFFIIVIFNTLSILLLFYIDVWLFNILFTKKLGVESILVFEILLIAGLIMVPSILLGYSYLGALGHAKYANKSVIYASIFHLIGISILVLFDVITIYTVAYMVIVTQIIDFTYRVYGIRREQLW